LDELCARRADGLAEHVAPPAKRGVRVLPQRAAVRTEGARDLLDECL
jgi:hypothetical protein